MRNYILRIYFGPTLFQRFSSSTTVKWGATAAQVTELLQGFLHCDAPSISNPKGLATRMAALAREIREVIREAFKSDGESGALHDQFEAFQKVLLHDLTPEQFADMYAQTIGYGLFAARCHARSEKRFTRQNAAYLLPKTNPFLRQLFGHIAGPELDERITWAVDDLAELLARADIAAILTDFGRSTGREDPVVHFYETFLTAYDPKMREARGVYYTPEPIVSYIVRSVDHILKNDFKLAEGLADATRVKLKRGKRTLETHKVQILDPAVGTATFLYSVIQHIRDTFRGNEGLWSGYVRDHLLPRLYGFELLMAPYAIAHMKLGLQLQQYGYDFKSEERLRVYLTNTLEEAHELTGLPLFTQWLAEEANRANEVKQDAPIMVVLGNPPYSGHSANTGAWIAGLLRGEDSATKKKTGSYFEVDGKPLGERNPKWLNDDYVKFIRFAQWRIEQTGYGVLAFVTNHGYLDNPTFRGMRQCLMHSFDDIYLLDLHGNTKKKEKAPEGGKEENVFDIQQGVAIGIFVKRPVKRAVKSAYLATDHEVSPTSTVRHAELWSSREGKYRWLWENDVASTAWKVLKPQTPFYLFTPQDDTLRAEYEAGWKITDIMPVNSVGIVTARDALTIHWSREDAWRTVTDFAVLPAEAAREKYHLGADARDWKVTLAQADLKASGPSQDHLAPILYRPFDVRYTYYTGNSRGFHCMPRGEVMGHILGGENIGLVIGRAGQVIGVEEWDILFITKCITEFNFYRRGGNNLFPLYLYPKAEKIDLIFDHLSPVPTGHPLTLGEGRGEGNCRPNLSPVFIADVSRKLKLTFIHNGQGDLDHTFGPEDVFNYIYAVLHSPNYRLCYAEFLKIDFPRIPLTTNVHLFRDLSRLGEELVALHLMKKMASPITRYPMTGDNKVDQVRYTEPGIDGTAGRVWINRIQYFEGVPPEVWSYHIGGYQIAQKWLKDRKGRQLTYDDLTHYQRIISALAKTLRIQDEIDRVIGKWPMS
jgi:predicted helicase